MNAAERVAALEGAFYAAMHDRERMAALLLKAADLIRLEQSGPAPLDLLRLQGAEQQRLARLLSQFAMELLTAEPS